MKLKTLREFLIVFLAAGGTFFSASSYGQSEFASARHYTEKPFLFDGERQLFYIELINPTSSSLREVTATVSYSVDIEVRGLDGRCSQSPPGDNTEIICTLPELERNSLELIPYSIVGDIDFKPSLAVSMSVRTASGFIVVQTQDSDAEGLSDNSRLIEGPEFRLSIARDVLRDSDADGVSDVSELSIGTDPSDPASVSDQNAVIDVVVLQSEETDRHYDGRFGGRIDYLFAATNQYYRENNIGITLRLVALGTLDYDSAEQTTTEIFNELSERSNSAFSDIDLIMENTGADVAVFAHPVFPTLNPDPDFDPDSESTLLCFVAQSNSNAIQGDFQKEFFGSRMVSVLNSSRDCLGVGNLAVALALNMGVVRSRQSNPNGGTFSFSSGHVQGEYFETVVPSSVVSEASEEGRGTRINLFSNPERLCLGRPCGVDRNSLVSGADAVFSLNATRHLIADLSPTVKPLSSADIDPRITIDAANNESIEVRQFSNSRSIIRGDWVFIQVEARNTSSSVLNHLEFRFGGASEVEPFRTSDNQCSILVTEDTELRQDLFGSKEGLGDIVCYVNSLQPGETAGFSYSVKVDSPTNYFGQNAFLSSAVVNSQFMRDAQACFVVSENSAGQTTAVDVCPAFIDDANYFTDPRRGLDTIELTLLPEIIEDILTVPFVRLFDGGLVSAQFKIIEGAPNHYELIDLNYLSTFLTPTTAAAFNADGTFTLRNATIDGLGGYNMTLQLSDETEPAVFVESQITRP